MNNCVIINMINKDKNKKAQISIFIIVAILMLLFSSVILLIINLSVDEDIGSSIKISDDSLGLYSFVSSCLKQTTEDAVYLLGQRGGILYSAENSLMVYSTKYRDYGIVDDSNTFFNMNFMQKGINRYIEENIGLCLDDFSVFKRKGINVEAKDMVVETLINPEEVVVELDYEISASSGNTKTNIDRFIVAVPVRLGKIVDDVLNNMDIENSVSLTGFTVLGYDVMIVPFDKRTILYSIVDPYSDMFHEPYIFSFVKKTQPNSRPLLEPLPDFKITSGTVFEYNVLASDDDLDRLFFQSSNDYIPIDEDTGLISKRFDSPGEYETTISVVDEKRAVDSVDVRFVVE